MNYSPNSMQYQPRVSRAIKAFSTHPTPKGPNDIFQSKKIDAKYFEFGYKGWEV